MKRFGLLTARGYPAHDVTGTVQCDSDTGRVNARASARDVGHFSSAHPSEITIDRAETRGFYEWKPSD